VKTLSSGTGTATSQNWGMFNKVRGELAS